MSVRPPIFFFPNSYFADEHGVRGGRRVDHRGRMVMRPSDGKSRVNGIILFLTTATNRAEDARFGKVDILVNN